MAILTVMCSKLLLKLPDQSSRSLYISNWMYDLSRKKSECFCKEAEVLEELSINDADATRHVIMKNPVSKSATLPSGKVKV